MQFVSISGNSKGHLGGEKRDHHSIRSATRRNEPSILNSTPTRSSTPKQLLGQSFLGLDYKRLTLASDPGKTAAAATITHPMVGPDGLRKEEIADFLGWLEIRNTTTKSKSAKGCRPTARTRTFRQLATCFDGQV